jgi:TolB-like protein
VVIDDTRDANARVPEEFLHVQWTRLPGGETPPAFAQRVRHLLGGDSGSLHNQQSTDPGAHRPGARRQQSARSGLAGRGRQRLGRRGVALIALLLVLGGGGVWYHQAANDAPAAISASTTDSASAVPGGTPATAQGAPGAPADAQPSVAVLPFVALSSGPDDGYFADGLTEEIINALTALPDLLVTARTSAFFFKGKEIPVPEIAATLGVAHIVEGSVRRSGDTARITAQLIRAADGFHLWSETYDHSLSDAFAVQTRIAESVAAALGVLLDERKRAMMADIGVRDVEAFVAYQRGVELFNRAHNEGPLVPLLARANVEFEAAIARKPDFAYAHFQHADYYAHLLVDDAPGQGAGFVSETGVGLDEAAQRLAADLDAAFRYERDAGQRLVVQVVRTTVSADWRSLGDQIERAFAAWEKCRHGLWIDQTAIVFGYGEAALAHDLRRERCDPLGGNWTRTAITAIWIGRPLDGLKYADRIEALRGQDRDVMHARILAYLALGRLDEAEALFDAGNFGAPDISEAMSLLELQIPAAAGRAAEWEQLRPTLERDPGRLLVGAAVFGDRETANRTAAEVDAMTLGPAILLRITDRCGCGEPFDLDATPNFARLLREGNLPWSPPAPIEFPLKDW